MFNSLTIMTKKKRNNSIYKKIFDNVILAINLAGFRNG